MNRLGDEVVVARIRRGSPIEPVGEAVAHGVLVTANSRLIPSPNPLRHGHCFLVQIDSGPDCCRAWMRIASNRELVSLPVWAGKESGRYCDVLVKQLIGRLEAID